MNPWKTLAWVAAFWSVGAAAQQIAVEPLPSIRPLVLRVPEATQSVRLTRVKVDVTVVGRLARTTLELAFYNPNPRVLEGELQFPLLAGQQVSGFALDFDGKWRPAVPVEKARGQEIFEEITRGRIDPALLEVTQGNNYKLRVYPIPARGERKVSLTLSERLPEGRDGAPLLRLPLAFGGRLDEFDLRIQAPGVKAAGLQIVRGLSGAQWQPQAEGALLEMRRRDYTPEKLAELRFPPSPGMLATLEEFAGKPYFYAEILMPKMAPAPRPKPARVALVWDASGSGANRDHGREFALLDAWFKAIGSTQVQLILARDVAEEGGSFAIREGNWSALRAALEKVVYDGGTNPAAFALPGDDHGDAMLRPQAGPQAVLLFSDGLANFGAPAMPGFAVPVLAVSAAAAADGERLRQVAEKSGGAYVDLLRMHTAAALNALCQSPPRLLSLRSNGAGELVAGAPDGSGRVAVAGVLNEAAATLELEWLAPNGKVERQNVRLARSETMARPFAAQAWAQLRLATLLPERTLHQAEIVRLGKRFGLVTPGTSLIVLDRVEDYVRYEIVPPSELREAYERLLATGLQQRQREKSAHLEDIVRRFQQKVKWWERDFPKGERPKAKESAKAMAGAVGSAESMVMPRVRPSAPAAENPPMRAQLAPSPAARMAEARVPGKPEALADGSAPQASIQLKKWTPDAPYAERLRKAAAEQLYKVYLDERPGWINSTAFFLDAADVFFERGQPELALRILSNLAEMDLENRHILRILAYRLSQAKRADLAVPILQRVRDLAPNEPQSWRDLGLALAETGERQQAIEALTEVVTRPWHNRFPDIELIALAELNAIVATTPQKLDVSGIDARLLKNLPLDLRVVLSWDADNTDIDLWVTDPNGEKAYFGNPLSYQGGAVSRDFIGGYGPEEFSLKKAKPGKYLVQAQFYGHRQQVVAGATTLSLRLFTGFGTPAQKEERVTLRLKGQSEMVTVGEFVVGE